MHGTNFGEERQRSMNKALLVGNLTKDPEYRQTQGDKTVCTFTLAVSRRFGNGTDFHPVVAWGTLADNCYRYLKKGDKAGVMGSIQTRNYDDRNGQKRYVTEIVADEVEFLSKKAEMTQVEDDDLPY